MMKNKIQIKKWLDKHFIVNYTISDYLIVDVDGDVNLNYFALVTIDIKFGIVNGKFDCFNNYLTSLKGCPKIVKGYFNCDLNPNLKSLEHLPIIYGNCICSDNLKECKEYKQWKMLKALRK